jgi:hypothetical protein
MFMFNVIVDHNNHDGDHKGNFYQLDYNNGFGICKGCHDSGAELKHGIESIINQNHETTKDINPDGDMFINITTEKKEIHIEIKPKK